MIEMFTSPELLIALLTLTVLEIVLGVDNVIFISILSAKLPKEQQQRARRVGLMGAMLMRIALLFSISWMARLVDPLFSIGEYAFSGRDLILLGGGLFLLAKATYEIHDKLEGEEGHASGKVAATFASVITQVMILDIVFSLDSVITAIGMAKHIPIMVAAMLIAVGVMMAFAGPLGDFVQKHPSMRILALAFLILIGVMLIVESTGQHVSKGYIYAAMAFSLLVELLNLRRRSRAQRLTAHAVTA